LIGSTIQRKVTTRELSLAATLAAVYIVFTFIPISPFIGSPGGFITAEILMLPLIAALLSPVMAGVSTTAGSLGMAIFGRSFYAVFGPLGLLAPIIATVLGSIAFHYRYGLVLPWSYVVLGAVYYFAFSQGGTLLWLAPYLIVIVSLPVVLRVVGSLRTGFLSLYTAMSEQVTLNILSISALGLVGGFWTAVTPFMFSERAIATLGGTFLIVALKSRLGERLETSSRSLGR
jgi:hypothetical protein